MAMPPSINDWSQRMRQAARNEPKKFGALGLLGLVLVILLGRVMLTGSSAPTAVSASKSEPSPVSNKNTAQSLLALPDPGSPALAQWLGTPIVPVVRNLFTIKLDYYPQDGAKVNQTLRAPQGNGFWDKLAKSMASKADQRKERQILIENLRLQAMQLKLQSTVMGATPRALVNGGMVREGDVVASFRVLRIEARRIIVEREGIKLEIQMH
jgi:hypothetical protein